MSNKAHDHVHRLIHSMSRAEKRYFKLHLQRHAHGGPSVGGQLFDAIAGMATYDEAALLERFKGRSFTKRFAITKRRLYESVLRALDAFHAERSLDSRLDRSLHQVRILYDRALYEDAAKLVHGTWRLARQHDRLPTLLALLEWEHRLAERDNYAHADAAQLKALQEKVQALRTEQQELDVLWALKTRVFTLLYREGPARDEAAREELHAVMRQVAAQGPQALHSAKARFLYHHIHSAVAFALGDLATCKTQLEANRELLQAEKQRFQEEPTLILSVLGNLAYVCMALGLHQEAMAHLAAFRRAPEAWRMPESEDLEVKLFSTTCSLELSLHLQRGDVRSALAMLPLVERSLERHAHRLGPIRRAGFHFQLAQVQVLAGDATAALRWMNRLLDELRPDESAEIATAARLLYLVVLYEAGKRDLLGYAIRNTERFLRSRDRLHPAEQHVLALFRLLQKEGDVPEREHALRRFREEWSSARPDEAGRTGHFDVLAWVESQLTGRPLMDVVRERAGGLDRAA